MYQQVNRKYTDHNHPFLDNISNHSSSNNEEDIEMRRTSVYRNPQTDSASESEKQQTNIGQKSGTGKIIEGR